MNDTAAEEPRGLSQAEFEEAIDQYLHAEGHADNSMLTTGWVLIAESAVVSEDDMYGVSYACSDMSLVRQLGLVEYVSARLKARAMDLFE